LKKTSGVLAGVLAVVLVGVLTMLVLGGGANPPGGEDAPVVYAAGFYVDSITRVPCYWKDGELTPLELPEGAVDREAWPIAVVEP
jgi:hypothetical protein